MAWIRCIRLAIGMLIILCMVAGAVAAKHRYNCDVNGDGRVSILDLTLVRNAILSYDVNGDGKVDHRDLKLVERAILSGN